MANLLIYTGNPLPSPSCFLLLKSLMYHSQLLFTDYGVFQSGLEQTPHTKSVPQSDEDDQQLQLHLVGDLRFDPVREQSRQSKKSHVEVSIRMSGTPFYPAFPPTPSLIDRYITIGTAEAQQLQLSDGFLICLQQLRHQPSEMDQGKTASFC